MKKRCFMLALAVAVALFGGCGEYNVSQERESFEESDYGHEESTPNPTVKPEESTEAPLLSSVFASAKPGNELQFGAYEQDNNLSNGAESIEWVVLANEGDKILVLSKYVLEGEMKGYEEIKDDKIPNAFKGALTWEVSRERKWLNSIFYEGAFSDEERNCILESKITTPNTEGTWKGRYNQPFHTGGGNDTQDYLFSLSYEEFEKYVKPLDIALAEATATSGVHVDKETGYATWMLRSPGSPSNWVDDYTVTSSGYSGDFTGINRRSGDRYSNGVFQDGRSNEFAGMRPAMWLRVK